MTNVKGKKSGIFILLVKGTRRITKLIFFSPCDFHNEKKKSFFFLLVFSKGEFFKPFKKKIFFGSKKTTQIFDIRR